MWRCDSIRPSHSSQQVSAKVQFYTQVLVPRDFYVLPRVQHWDVWNTQSPLEGGCCYDVGQLVLAVEERDAMVIGKISSAR